MQSQCSSAAVSTPSSPAQSDDSNSSGSSSSSGGNSSNSSISTSDAPDDCNSVARSRWKILAQALQKTGPVTTIPTSVRRFQSYGLVTALPLENLHENSATWCEYSANIGQEMFSVLVRHPKRSFTASDLMGFNNTGNICVWPSEEVLAYYGLCNREMFCGKSVLEVGGGMSCLAGLMIGKYTDAARVHLTDGNASSMDNVQRILEKNGFGASSHVTSSVLQWGKRSKVCNRADYWKSQPRKLCEFCKCWIADNKPSITFHEGGKRHKENVAKRLSEISKKSAQEAKGKLQVDNEIRKMEQAAMKAYMKDIEANADFTSQLVLMDIEEKKKKAEEEAKQEAEAKRAAEEAEQKAKAQAAAKRKKILKKAATIKWYEAASDQGHSYYWHVDTNESRWEAPDEGYLSISEQKIMKDDGSKKEQRKESVKMEEAKPVEEKKRRPDLLMEVKKHRPDHGVGGKKRKPDNEKDAGKRKNKLKQPQPVCPVTMGPAPKSEPYGTWKTIENKVVEPVDLQLPQQTSWEINVPAPLNEKPKIRFHEKKVTTLDEDDESKVTFSSFKKKSAFRGNVRQRLDTDD